MQDKVRYVFLGMNTGGYVPADADVTWARRFGDCKGKTTLLLAVLHELGIAESHPYATEDLLTGEKFIWNGEKNFVELDPAKGGAHIIRVTRALHREQDFDYFL